MYYFEHYYLISVCVCNLKQIQSALLLKIDIRAAVHAQWRSRNKSSMNNVHSREKRY